MKISGARCIKVRGINIHWKLPFPHKYRSMAKYTYTIFYGKIIIASRKSFVSLLTCFLQCIRNQADIKEIPDRKCGWQRNIENMRRINEKGREISSLHGKLRHDNMAVLWHMIATKEQRRNNTYYQRNSFKVFRCYRDCKEAQNLRCGGSRKPFELHCARQVIYWKSNNWACTLTLTRPR